MSRQRDTNRRKVLIVDDHPFVREGLKQYIEQQPDFTVCADVGTPVEALAVISQRKLDLAVVDLSLQSTSGLDLIRQIRTRDQQLPILVLSMHEESVHSERVLRAGAQGYIMKREAPEQVLTAMRQVLNGRCYVSQRIAGRLVRRYVQRRGDQEQLPPLKTQLSTRETQVLQLIGDGLRRTRIAQKLHISVKTVETHCQRIKDKLGMASADELREYAFQHARQGPLGPAPRTR